MTADWWVFPWCRIRLWLVPKLLKKVDLAKYEIGLWVRPHSQCHQSQEGEGGNYNINILLRHSSQTLSGADCAQRSPPILIRKLGLPALFKLPAVTQLVVRSQISWWRPPRCPPRIDPVGPDSDKLTIINIVVVTTYNTPGLISWLAKLQFLYLHRN